MNETLDQLLENGRRKIREAELAEEKRQEERKAKAVEEERTWREAILQAVVDKLPEAFVDNVSFPINHPICGINEIVLTLKALFPIRLTVWLNTYPEPSTSISGSWITVPGIRYIRPNIDYENDELYEGLIEFPYEAQEREYGFDAWPLDTTDIEIALAIAEQRFEQFMELDQDRLKRIDELNREIEDERAKFQDEPEEVIQTAEQTEGILLQPKIGQIQPLAELEKWVRSIVSDEISGLDR